MSREAQLMAVSAVDGRYAERLGALPEIVSEYGLIKRRVEVMSGWVSVLGSGVLPDREPLGDNAHSALEEMSRNFTIEDAKEVKNIESTTNHDVKAVEIWLTRKLGDLAFDEVRDLVHFGCTSEDVNSAAYALIVRDAHYRVFVPVDLEIYEAVAQRAYKWADIPMLAMTHGQPATPTTLGKEMAIFAERYFGVIKAVGEIKPEAKFSGASGNYNSAMFAYPEVDWERVSREFVNDRLGLSFNSMTAQIEPHDWIARYNNELALGNTILSDLAKDMWLYISRGVLKQRPKAGETGSSTMPHKVNPIDFENAEGNYDTANNVLVGLARSLPISRMQRDLSDSTRLRTLGTGFAHTLVGHRSILKGLSKVEPNKLALARELDENPAVLTEAVQTVMRRFRIPNAYDRMKDASRGQELQIDDYLELVRSLQDELPDEVIQRLIDLRPKDYIGKAAELAARA